MGEDHLSDTPERNITPAVVMLLPLLDIVIDQAQPVPDDGATVAVPIDAVRALAEWRQINLGAAVAAQEFWEWAVANAPGHLVSNLARCGLVV